jgi:hypothetical protein
MSGMGPTPCSVTTSFSRTSSARTADGHTSAAITISTVRRAASRIDLCLCIRSLPINGQKILLSTRISQPGVRLSRMRPALSDRMRSCPTCVDRITLPG